MAFILPTGLDVNWLECLSRFPAAAHVVLASSSICIPNKTRPEIDVRYMFKAIFNQWSLGLLWKIIRRSQSILGFAVSCRTALNTQWLQLLLPSFCFVSSMDEGEGGALVDSTDLFTVTSTRAGIWTKYSLTLNLCSYCLSCFASLSSESRCFRCLR